jgi:hypothetical protein
LLFAQLNSDVASLAAPSVARRRHFQPAALSDDDAPP